MWLLHLNKKTLGALLIAGTFLAAPTRRMEDFGDFIGNYNFKVEIDGVAAGQFTGVDGLSVETEVVEYRDGTDTVVRKRPGRVKYGDITLKRGYVSDPVLLKWREEVARNDYAAKQVGLSLQDNAGTEVKRWNCFECFPKSWKVSSLDGKGNDVLTEEMVIVIEWFEEA